MRTLKHINKIYMLLLKHRVTSILLTFKIHQNANVLC